jgi:hypothetical protein
VEEFQTEDEMRERLAELEPVEEEYRQLMEQAQFENMLLYHIREGFVRVEEIDGEHYLFPVEDEHYINIPE